jgi:outer membrane protein assembly factor BamB
MHLSTLSNVLDYTNRQYAVDSQTRELKWKFRTSGAIFSSPVVADGVIYVGTTDDFLYALDSQTRKQIWRFKTEAGIKSTPLIANGMVYFGSEDGKFYALR